MDKTIDLRSIYYDPKQGFVSLDKLRRKTGLPQKQIQSFLEKQETYLVNKETKKPQSFRTIIATHPGECYQMDIIVYDRYEINKYKYILVVIDVYSRYVQAVAMTNMLATTIKKKMEQIFTTMGPPSNLNADQQFSTSKVLLDYFDRLGITLYASETDELYKNAIVERFNRTLAGMLQRWRSSAPGLRHWYKVLPDIVENYNNTWHRTIKRTPQEVWDRRKIPNQKLTFQQAQFRVGDKVRAKYEDRTFNKGDRIKFTKEVYVITNKPKPNRYTLQNIRNGKILKKAHKDYELIRAVGES